jgi:hypothetical protein
MPEAGDAVDQSPVEPVGCGESGAVRLQARGEHADPHEMCAVNRLSTNRPSTHRYSTQIRGCGTPSHSAMVSRSPARVGTGSGKVFDGWRARGSPARWPSC